MKLNLSTSEILELEKVQRNMVGSPYYVKVTCVLMLAKNYSPKTVSDCLGIDLSTVYRYVALYELGGVAGLTESRYKSYQGRLSEEQISLLRSELKSHIYTDAKSVCAWVKEHFGMEYTPQGMVDLLNRIGFTYKKTREVPCEADAGKQSEFMNELSEILKAKDESVVVYYADGVHPTHNSRSTYAWIEKGQELEQPTVSGRERVNINGLLNAYDVTDVIAHDCESVNAASTKALYMEALEKHSEASRIYIISDNAKYYRNKELNEWIKGTKITPLFLPPYSPNLNLIERLWKFLRKKVINTGFYRTKGTFRKAINDFFENIECYKEELESLLTLNFRLINSQTFSF